MEDWKVTAMNSLVLMVVALFVATASAVALSALALWALSQLDLIYIPITLENTCASSVLFLAVMMLSKGIAIKVDR